MPYRNKTPKRPSTCAKNPFFLLFRHTARGALHSGIRFSAMPHIMLASGYDQKKLNRQFRLPQLSFVFLLLLKLDPVPLVSVFSLINRNYCQKNLSYSIAVHDDINALCGSLSAHPARNVVKQIVAAPACQLNKP